MTREILENGMIRLRSANGILDSRTGKIHYDVICSEENEKYFKEVIPE